LTLKDELLSKLKRAKNEYSKRKKSAEANVLRWQWRTSGDQNLQPFYFERHRFSRGKRLPAKPKTMKEGYVAYGMDAKDRIVVERSYSGIVHRGQRWFYETFYEYSGRLVEWVYYDYSQDKDPIALHRATFSGERIVALMMRGIGGGFTERYLYDDDRIIRIERDEIQPNDPRPKSKKCSGWLEVHWDELGRVAKITEWDPDESQLYTIFQRPAKGQTLKETVAVLEELLVAQIPKAVAALRLKEPAYSLVLAYDGEGNDMLPPALGVGIARERDKWLSTKAEEAQWMLWNPAEYKHYDRGSLCLSDKRLLSICEKANQEIAMKDKWAVGRALLDRVATSLRSLSWKSLLPITDDFVVYAVDFELGTLRKSLRAASGKQQFARWLRDRWVPAEKER
jgi:hypothetical protein